jgi:lycopene cyclase domain-containing protein
MNLYYVMLNLLFAWIAWAVLRHNIVALSRRPVWLSMSLVLALTLVFDNVIVGLGIVTYDPERIIGVRLGFAPIEDFAYAVVGAFLIPAIWGKIKA